MDDPSEVQNLLQFVYTDRIPLAIVLVALGWISLKVLGRVLGDLGERFTDRRLFLKKANVEERLIIQTASKKRAWIFSKMFVKCI